MPHRSTATSGGQRLDPQMKCGRRKSKLRFSDRELKSVDGDEGQKQENEERENISI
jgi:hypothetical protein